jgi:hypothetical protein
MGAVLMPTTAPSLPDLAIWTVVALGLWLLLIAGRRHLGARMPAVVAAPVSWVLARILMSASELIRWATEALAHAG